MAYDDRTRQHLRRLAELVREDPSITVAKLAREMQFSQERSVYYWLEKGRFKGIKDFRRSVLTGQLEELLAAPEEGSPAVPPASLEHPSGTGRPPASKRARPAQRGRGVSPPSGFHTTWAPASRVAEGSPIRFPVLPVSRLGEAGAPPHLPDPGALASEEASVERMVPQSHLSEAAFGVTVDTDEYRPWLRPGDLLLVDPKSPPRDGDLVVLHLRNGGGILRHYYAGQPALLVHPADPSAVEHPAWPASGPSDPAGEPRNQEAPGDLQLVGRVVQLFRRL